MLPGCETLEKLQTVFHDRFDRTITKDELDILFSSIADQKLFEESALQHPLLEQYAKRSFEVVDGKAVHKSFSTVGQAAPAQRRRHGARGRQGGRWHRPRPAAGRGRRHRRGFARGVADAEAVRPAADTEGARAGGAPLRYAMYAVPVLLLVAIVLAANNWHVLSSDLGNLHAHFSLFARVIFMLLTASVLSVVVMSFVANAFRVSVDKIGITVLLGFIRASPRT